VPPAVAIAVTVLTMPLVGVCLTDAFALVGRLLLRLDRGGEGHLVKRANGPRWLGVGRIFGSFAIASA
jgi:hypothetical protein